MSVICHLIINVFWLEIVEIEFFRFQADGMQWHNTLASKYHYISGSIKDLCGKCYSLKTLRNSNHCRVAEVGETQQ